VSGSFPSPERALTCSRESLSERVDDVGRSPSQIAPGVFVDAVAEVLQFVAAMGVAGSVGGVRVAEAARNLYHDPFWPVEEIDSGNVDAVALDPALRLGSMKTGFADELEEPTLQDRLAAGVEQQLVKQSDPLSAPTSKACQALGQDPRRRQAKSNGTVDRGSQSIEARPAGGQVEHRPRRRRTAEAVDGQNVDGSDNAGRVHDGTTNLNATRGPRNREHGVITTGTIELEQLGGGFMADESRRPESQQANLQPLMPGVRGPTDHHHARRRPLQPTAIDQTPPRLGGHTETLKLRVAQRTVLLPSSTREKGEVRHLSWASADPPTGNHPFREWE
jgi:hypothetical protein